MTGHARLSPSGSKKWMACPGSITLESLVPNKSTTYSDEGTACHEIAATCLTGGGQAADHVGAYVKVNGPGEPERKVRFTAEMAELTQQYVDDIRRLRVGGVLWVEQRVDFSSWVDVPEQFGTADAVILRPAEGAPEGTGFELQIHDAKFGRTPVAVENNSQLMLYALGFVTSLLRQDPPQHLTETQEEASDAEELA